jgi:glutamine amidotransferase
VIAVVDYGIGNLGSVAKAFRHLGAPVTLSGDPEALRSAPALVLPGDGAFGAAMDELERRQLLPVLHEAVRDGRPLLGICIGMQLLFEESEEHGRHRGLGLLKGRVRRLDPGPGLPVPHMGWNSLEKKRPHWLLDGIEDGAYVYFVHSYVCHAEPESVLATSDYGDEIAAVVGRERVVGVQFHPEKSQRVGLKLLGNFVEHCLSEVTV